MKKISYTALAIVLAIGIVETNDATANVFDSLKNTVTSTATKIKDKITGTKPAAPLSATQTGATKPGTTAPTILACDRGTAIRKDGKPCQPPCDAGGGNPFDGSKNCIPPSKLSQIGTTVKENTQTGFDIYKNNEQTVMDNIADQKARQAEGQKADRNSHNIDTGGGANALGIG